jgi:hypothetical protein
VQSARAWRFSIVVLGASCISIVVSSGVLSTCVISTTDHDAISEDIFEDIFVFSSGPFALITVSGTFFLLITFSGTFFFPFVIDVALVRRSLESVCARN